MRRRHAPGRRVAAGRAPAVGEPVFPSAAARSPQPVDRRPPSSDSGGAAMHGAARHAGRSPRARPSSPRTGPLMLPSNVTAASPTRPVAAATAAAPCSSALCLHAFYLRPQRRVSCPLAAHSPGRLNLISSLRLAWSGPFFTPNLVPNTTTTPPLCLRTPPPAWRHPLSATLEQ